MKKWYAFRVPSQREFTAHEFLTEKRGLEAFVPDEHFLARPRRVKQGERPKDNWRKRALLIGYVLINTDEPHALVHRFGILQSVVSFDGIAAPIKPNDIVKLMAKSGRVVARESAPLKLNIGQTIRITNGAGQGLAGKITSAKGERASIALAKPLLGKSTIEVKLGSLEAA